MMDVGVHHVQQRRSREFEIPRSLPGCRTCRPGSLGAYHGSTEVLEVVLVECTHQAQRGVLRPRAFLIMAFY